MLDTEQFTQSSPSTMPSEITEQVQKVRVEILTENPNPRLATFEEIFAKRKRLKEEARKAREESMKRA